MRKIIAVFIVLLVFIVMFFRGPMEKTEMTHGNLIAQFIGTMGDSVFGTTGNYHLIVTD